MGAESGNQVASPEQFLGKYDLVFGKARCAIEAMASGCAVVVADVGGLGGLVTTSNVAAMRRLNFGLRTMQMASVTEQNVFDELSKYESGDAGEVSDWIRKEADMTLAIGRWLTLYGQVLAQWRERKTPDDVSMFTRQLHAASNYLSSLAPVVKGRYQAEAQARDARQALAAITDSRVWHVIALIRKLLRAQR